MHGPMSQGHEKKDTFGINRLSAPAEGGAVARDSSAGAGAKLHEQVYFQAARSAIGDCSAPIFSLIWLLFILPSGMKEILLL